MARQPENYTPPKGWRIKGDDEIVEQGERWTHWKSGDPHVIDFVENGRVAP